MLNDVSNQICEIIGTGSTGNAVLLHRQILIDIGVSYKKIEPYKKEIQLIALTHEHLSDHLNISALKKLCKERPLARVCCGHWMVKYLDGIKNIDVLEPGILYDYGQFKISAFKLYHNCEIYGYRIFKDNHSTFYATDTKHLEGITAKDYSLYCIEMNHDEEVLNARIEEKQRKGQFAYEIGSKNSHLSEQQAKEWLFKNMNESSKVIRLHESKNNI